MLSRQEANDKSGGEISLSRTVAVIARDALAEIMGLMVMAAVMVFQKSSTPPGSFANPWYLFASVCIPGCGAGYFERRTIGCVPDLAMDLPDDTPRTFPVAMVFHAMVTFSHWLMGLQLVAREKDLETIRKLRDDLQNASEKNKKLK